MNRQHLPQPCAQDLARSQALHDTIKAEINAAGNGITFARFMELALYTPALGYYCSPKKKFGAPGDFVTAPELSPLFAQCIAKPCQQVLQTISNGDILEYGPGSGIMAATLLITLAENGSLPQHYYMLEISTELQQQQRATITQYCPQFLDRVIWLQTLPAAGFKGILIANEMLDAMPIHSFKIENGQILEGHIGCRDNQLSAYFAQSDNATLVTEVSKLQQNELQNCVSYRSELNLQLSDWLQNVNQSLQQGLLLLIDYGYPQHEYYHPDRTMGTLMCHYQHYAHTDPLYQPGLQDITAHVNFTAIAESSLKTELKLAGYTNQAAFLLSCGLCELIKYSSDSEQVKLNQAIKLLTHPNEMGELFKVMSFTKQLDIPIPGSEYLDLRSRL